jgi:putative PIN family toxin of toxin-antitoxin system
VLREGVCRTVVDVAQRKGQMVRSEKTFSELVETLEKPRLQKYLTAADKIDFLSNFLQLAQPITTTETIIVCRDPKDDMFLELAIGCKATAIVTRDGDLLSLNPFRSIPIITVTNFLKLFGEGL